MECLKVADALTHIFNIFKRSNKYIDETMPWILGKDEDKKDRLSTVLYNLSDSIVTGAALLHPFLPETAEKILAQLNTAMPDIDALDKRGNFASGTKVTEDPETLFQRVKAEDVAKTVEALYPAKKEEGAKAEKPKKGEAAPDLKKAQNKETVTYDDFVKSEFRVGEIIEASVVEKSEKLLRFKVRIGEEERHILSGIRKYYPEPEKLIGKKVMAITNLAPRKMAGYESQGMLLCAEDAEGKLALMTTDENIIAGAEIS
jgi:methionyl-tRNA synthetase